MPADFNAPLSPALYSAVPDAPLLPQRNAQRGGSHLKLVVWLLVVLAILFASFRIVPVLVDDFQFTDGIQDIARFASVNRQSVDDITNAVLKEAVKDDLPVSKENIKVESMSGNIRINVQFSVPVDLLVYQWTMNFNPSVSNNSLI